MTATEIEQLLDLLLVALLPALDGMSGEDFQQVRRHLVIVYMMYRATTPRPSGGSSSRRPRSTT
jgi:hypothetical protein